MDRITMSNTNTEELFKRAADWIEASTDGNNVSIVEVRVSDPVMYITAKITRSIGCIETTIAFSAHSLFDPESSLTNTRQFENFINGSLRETSTATSISGNPEILTTEHFRQFVGKLFDAWVANANITFPEGDSYTIDIRMVESLIMI